MTRSGLDMSHFTIIIPTYNEVQNIQHMIASLLRLYPEIEILVVDDNSIDGTIEFVKDLALKNPSIRLIVRDPEDRGLTASLMDGIINTKTKYFIIMDADFQHPPDKVGDIMEKLSTGYAIAVGTRNDIEALSLIRRLASWGANFLAQSYLFLHRKTRPRDLMSGFFGGDAIVWKNVVINNNTKFERQGFKALFDLMKFSPVRIEVAEVKYDFGERSCGESKLDSRVIISLLRQCGYLGKFAAALVSLFYRKPAKHSPDQEIAATMRP